MGQPPPLIKPINKKEPSIPSELDLVIGEEKVNKVPANEWLPD